MIFSRQQLETAYAYAGIYTDKILLINFVEDSFKPIKVDSKEWDKLPKFISFTEWVKEFIASPYYDKCSDHNPDKLTDLLNPSLFIDLNHVWIVNYYKFIQGDYHIIQAELYPIGSGLAYLITKDLTRMKKGAIEDGRAV